MLTNKALNRCVKNNFKLISSIYYFSFLEYFNSICAVIDNRDRHEILTDYYQKCKYNEYLIELNNDVINPDSIEDKLFKYSDLEYYFELSREYKYDLMDKIKCLIDEIIRLID